MTDRPLRLTEKRLRALRLIQQRPGLFVSDLTDICDAPDLNGRPFNGFARAHIGAQAATRWGASYARPLIEAGLVVSRPVTPGCARLWLTARGQEVAKGGSGDE